MDLQDKVAVVTGASSGIGAAIAKALSKAGTKLLVTARRENRLEDLASQLSGECEIFAADIAAAQTPTRLLDQVRRRFGRVDVLVNNAGTLSLGLVGDVDVEHLIGCIRVNYEAVVRASHVFGSEFKAQRSGAIINISSIAAFGTAPGVGVYAGTKAAVETFSSSLRIELGPFGVKVGTLAPGTTQTPMQDELRARRSGPADSPPVQPESVAAAVRFMLEQPDEANIAAIRYYAAAQPA